MLPWSRGPIIYQREMIGMLMNVRVQLQRAGVSCSNISLQL
jgi:hypothetical protein